MDTIPSKLLLNKSEAPARLPPPSKPTDPQTKEETIIIHVCDEKKKVEKDFKCK